MPLARTIHRGSPHRSRSIALAALAGTAVFAPIRAAQAQAAEPTGRIDGVATLARKLTSQHRRVRIYAEPSAREAVARVDEDPLQNVVIYLEDAPAGADAGAGAAPAMRQRGERFVPHVLPVVVGSAVAFPNDDPIYHNVFSLSQARSFDLGRFPKGESRSVTFPRAGVVQLFCHIHADMSGYILVLRNGFFAKPDSAGRFSLSGIPPGDYRLVAWHERIRPVAHPVRVTAGGTTEIAVSIPLSADGSP
jgi:plastocyanin